MKKKNIYFLILLVTILLFSFVISGCGNKPETTVATAEETTTPQETPAPEPEPTPEPLSPAMSRYQEAAKENILLLAQQEYLNNAIQYYLNIRTMTIGNDVAKKSFAEEVLGTEMNPEEGKLIDYPEFNPEAVEITIPEVSEEEADAKSEELESANEELRQIVTDLQTEADNLKLTFGM